MTSLTPNEDAFRSQTPPEEIQALARKKGTPGVVARLILAFGEAHGLSLSKELDRNSDTTDIIEGYVQALGNVIAGLAGGCSDNPHGLAIWMLAEITKKTAVVLADNDAGNCPGIRFEATPVHRA